MAIGIQAAKKQKALGGISAKGLISTRLEVIGLCRRHQNSHVVAAPVWIAVLAGAEIRTAEAVQTHQSHYPAFGCAIQGDSRRDLPQLPDRDDQTCEVPGWTPALPLLPMR